MKSGQEKGGFITYKSQAEKAIKTLNSIIKAYLTGNGRESDLSKFCHFGWFWVKSGQEKGGFISHKLKKP